MSSEGEFRLERAITPICEELEVRVVDVELRANSVLVTIDRDGGLDLDSLAAASRAISALLDSDERLAPQASYELEVTSPGLERRLRRPDHFLSAIGARVAIRTVPASKGERRASGTITAADDAGVEIRIEGSSSTRRIAYGEIERAHTVVDWQAALREGKARQKHEKVAMS